MRPVPGQRQRTLRHCLAMVLVTLLTCMMPLRAEGAAPEIPSAEVIEKVDSGVINWSTGNVHAIGVSSPLAIDDSAGGVQERVLVGAKANAHERLLLTARHVRICPGLTIGDVMDDTPRVAEELRALVQNLPVANQRYLSDGTVEIELILPLYGGPAQLLLPEEIRQVQPIKAISPSPPPAAPKSLPPPAPSAESSPKQNPYTGWVLDARGTGARAAMTISVRDESGRTVYGAAFVSREYAVHSGMSGYSTVMDRESAAARMGPNPLTTKVLRAVGEMRSDLVISNADAAKLRSAVAHLGFLRECRVLVVLDQSP